MSELIQLRDPAEESAPCRNVEDPPVYFFELPCCLQEVRKGPDMITRKEGVGRLLNLCSSKLIPKTSKLLTIFYQNELNNARPLPSREDPS